MTAGVDTASVGTVACVVPAFNAGATVGAVLEGLRRALPAASLLVVDDGSADDTAAVAVRRADVVLRHGTNRGKGAALRSGIAHALERGAAAVLTVDADGQHDPASAPALLVALRDADLVIGARRRQAPMPLQRRVTNGLATAAVRALAGVPVFDAQSGYRALRRAVLERVVARGDGYDYETDFLLRAARAGYRIAAVPVPTVYGGRSHFRAVTDGARVVRTIWGHRARVPRDRGQRDRAKG